jgi:hypothetical protein
VSTRILVWIEWTEIEEAYCKAGDIEDYGNIREGDDLHPISFVLGAKCVAKIKDMKDKAGHKRGLAVVFIIIGQSPRVALIEKNP